MNIFSWHFCWFLILLLAYNVESSQRVKRVIGGSLPKMGELKYQVSIQTMGIHVCGGGIISEQHVLTAAHCVIDQTMNQFLSSKIWVIAGLDNYNVLREGGMGTRVVKAYVPAFYNSLYSFPLGDMAVLKVKKKFNFTPGSLMSKLNLPPPTKFTGAQSVEEHKTATISGYGWDQSEIELKVVDGRLIVRDNGKSSGKLHKARVEIVRNIQCQNSFFNRIYEIIQLCGKVREKPDNVRQGICTGDSGGPLVHDNMIIGVVSYSRLGCDEINYPTVYTRVSSLLKFIENSMNDKITKNMRFGTW